MKKKIILLFIIILTIFIFCNEDIELRNFVREVNSSKNNNNLKNKNGTDILIKFNNVVKKQVNKGAAAVNLCWLLDSDLKMKRTPSTATALKELGCGALRFPYGHLADNYLWHSAPYEDTENGLRPKVASKQQGPGTWDWAVDSSSFFKKAMDFDEYMALCKKLGAKSLVCINILSHAYKGGPTYAELKTNAVEWVRYAKKRGYKVDYWQIGNEVDHHPKQQPLEKFLALYKDFATAMKEVNPKIKTGPGTLQQPAWYIPLIEEVPELTDFISIHQYMFMVSKTCTDYDSWKVDKTDYVRNVRKGVKYFRENDITDIEICITETGVSGGNSLGTVNNLYKALWWFEVLMNELELPNISYSFYWGLHSPWGKNGESETSKTGKDVGIALRADNNQRKPTGEIIKIVNQFILDQFVKTVKINGFLRTWAMKSKDGNAINIFIVNRNDKPKTISLELDGVPSHLTGKIYNFTGNSPHDIKPGLKNLGNITVKKGKLSKKLAPLSLTIFKLKTN